MTTLYICLSSMSSGNCVMYSDTYFLVNYWDIKTSEILFINLEFISLMSDISGFRLKRKINTVEHLNFSVIFFNSLFKVDTKYIIIIISKGQIVWVRKIYTVVVTDTTKIFRNATRKTHFDRNIYSAPINYENK